MAICNKNYLNISAGFWETDEESLKKIISVQNFREKRDLKIFKADEMVTTTHFEYYFNFKYNKATYKLIRG